MELNELLLIGVVPLICTLVVAAQGLYWMAHPDALTRTWGEATSPVRARDVAGAVGVTALFNALTCLAYVQGIARPALLPLRFGVTIGGLVGLSATHHVQVTLEPGNVEQWLVRAIVRRTGSSFLAFVVEAAWFGLVCSNGALLFLVHFGLAPPLNHLPNAEIIVLLISGAGVAGVATAIMQWLRFDLLPRLPTARRG